MKSTFHKKLAFAGLLSVSLIAAGAAYLLGGAARNYLEADSAPHDAEQPVAKSFEEAFDQLKQGKRVEFRHKVGDKTVVKTLEGSLPITKREYHFLHRIMARNAKVRRKAYDDYVTKLVNKENVSLADMEREAMMSFGALRAEFEFGLFKKGDYLVIDDKVTKPHIPKGWNWTRINRLYAINGQFRAVVLMFDPKKTPRLVNEYRRYKSLASSRLDEWARSFNQKTVSERKKIILHQKEIYERIQVLARKNKQLPKVSAEWVRLWKQRTPNGIRFDEASWYARLQQ